MTTINLLLEAALTDMRSGKLYDEFLGNIYDQELLNFTHITKREIWEIAHFILVDYTECLRIQLLQELKNTMEKVLKNESMEN